METSGKMNKKGSLLDIVWIALILLVFSFFVLIGTKVATEMQDRIAATPLFQTESAAGVAATAQVISNYETTVNSSFIFLTVFLGIIVLVLAALVRVHPIFIPIFLIGLIFVIFLAGIFSNIYQTAADNSLLSDIAAQYAAMHQIMVWLPIIIGVFGIILMVVMYKTWSIGQ